MADQKDNARKQREEITQAVRKIASTKEGVIFFRALMHRCYFHTSVVSGDPSSHDININGTLFNEAQRRIYLDIRRDIPPKQRRKIENQIIGEED